MADIESGGVFMGAAKFAFVRSWFVVGLSILPIPISAEPSAEEPANLLTNGSFEVGGANDPGFPEGWRSDRADVGSRRMADAAHGGHHAMELAYKHDPEALGYAGIIQGLDASKFQGQRIVLSGRLLRTNLKSDAGLWLAFVDENGDRLGYENDYDEPWGSELTWQSRRLEAIVPNGTHRIAVGISIFGATGRFRIDNVVLELAEMNEGQRE
jgi:hypothetical protein